MNQLKRIQDTPRVKLVRVPEDDKHYQCTCNGKEVCEHCLKAEEDWYNDDTNTLLK